MKPVGKGERADADLSGDAVVAEGASVGARVTICAGAFVPANVTLEGDNYVGPNVVFVDDGTVAPTPSAILVKRGTRIGANSTIHAGVTLGESAVIQPGSVVEKSVPPAAVVAGNPASIVGYAGSGVHANGTGNSGAVPSGVGSTPTSVRGVSIHRFPLITDMRGSLTVGEFGQHVPFEPLRYFIVFGVPNKEVRGEHAHRQCHQFLICVRGSCSVVADDGAERVEVTLDSPSLGIYLPPMVWGIQYRFSSDAALLVFASDHYDPSDYIRDYGAFRDAVASRTEAKTA